MNYLVDLVREKFNEAMQNKEENSFPYDWRNFQEIWLCPSVVYRLFLLVDDLERKIEDLEEECRSKK